MPTIQAAAQAAAAAQAQAPAKPEYILRGHSAQIHALRFWCQNSRLLSGDADGWLVVWDVEQSKRAVVTWKPHLTCVLGIETWGDDKIITHGRDNAVRVWHLPLSAENGLQSTLPVDTAASLPTKRTFKDPWLLHTIDSPAISFCTISTCLDPLPPLPAADDDDPDTYPNPNRILIASPANDIGAVEIIRLPEETYLPTIPPNKAKPTTSLEKVAQPSMLMALQILHRPDAGGLTALTAMESGVVAVYVLPADAKRWIVVYNVKCHTQPVLSIAAAPSNGWFFSSGADALVIKHFLPACTVLGNNANRGAQVFQTHHAGQQGLTLRSDERILATAGWDSRVRVYSTRTGTEVALLVWHKEACYSLAFAEVLAKKEQPQPKLANNAEAVAAGAIQNQRLVTMMRERRLQNSKYAHRLAAGSKDGKVSLWNIY